MISAPSPRLEAIPIGGVLFLSEPLNIQPFFVNVRTSFTLAMALTKEDVLKVANLARIELTDAQVEKFQPQLAAVLDYIEQLNKVDTNGVVETAQVTGLENVMRPDVITDCPDDERQATIEEAPQTVANMVRVTKVL